MRGQDLVEDFFQYIWTPGDLLEIRGRHRDPERTSVSAGLYNDMRQAAAAACMLNRDKQQNIGFCLNPVDPGSSYALEKRKNCMYHEAFPTARNYWIKIRSIFMVDIDPVRALKGVECAATAAEMEEARLVCERIKADLKSRVWPDPCIVASGSGYHMFYRADRCGVLNPDFAGVLKYLARKFDTAGAKVDQACYNGARHGRVPYLRNFKGIETADRPHRRAGIYLRPETFEPVSRLKVLELNQIGGGKTPPLGFNSAQKLVIDIDGVQDLMDEFPDQLPYSTDPEERDGMVLFYLDSCPVNGGPHTIQYKKTAIILRENSIGFSCFAGKCEQPTFRQVLQLVEEESGHEHETPIWADEETELEDDDECADTELIDSDPTLIPTVPDRIDSALATYQIPRLMQHAAEVIELDELTFDDLLAPIREFVMFEEQHLSGWKLESYLCQISHMVDTGDVKAMGRYLGAEMLDDLKFSKCQNRLMDYRFAEREKAERSASAWLDDPVPVASVWVTFVNLFADFREKALRIDGGIENYFGKLFHRKLMEQIVRAEDVRNMARFLGWDQVSEIALRVSFG